MMQARAQAALVVMDVFKTFDDHVEDEALRIENAVVEKIRRLSRRFRHARKPVIFVNDHLGYWQHGFDDIHAIIEGAEGKGAAIASALYPHPEDFKLLKPGHSAFAETPLTSLLAHLNVTRIVICGLPNDDVLLTTVTDAHLRGIGTTVPTDAMVSQTPERTAGVLAHLRASCNVPTPQSDMVPL